MVKQKKLRVRKENLILFVLLGLGLLFVLTGDYSFNLDSLTFTSPESEVTSYLEYRGYEVVKVCNINSFFYLE